MFLFSVRGNGLREVSTRAAGMDKENHGRQRLNATVGEDTRRAGVMIGTLIIFVIVTVVAIVCYSFGYYYAMKKAEDMLDTALENKFKNAGVVVRQDNRIIECNGMMIPMQCKECRFGRVKEDSVECFAPDYDGVPTIGLKR